MPNYSFTPEEVQSGLDYLNKDQEEQLKRWDEEEKDKTSPRFGPSPRPLRTDDPDFEERFNAIKKTVENREDEKTRAKLAVFGTLGGDNKSRDDYEMRRLYPEKFKSSTPAQEEQKNDATDLKKSYLEKVSGQPEIKMPQTTPSTTENSSFDYSPMETPSGTKIPTEDEAKKQAILKKVFSAPLPDIGASLKPLEEDKFPNSPKLSAADSSYSLNESPRISKNEGSNSEKSAEKSIPFNQPEFLKGFSIEQLASAKREGLISDDQYKQLAMAKAKESMPSPISIDRNNSVQSEIDKGIQDLSEQEKSYAQKTPDENKTISEPELAQPKYTEQMAKENIQPVDSKSESLVDLLKRAQEHRERSELISGLGKSFENLSGAIGGMVKRGTITKPTGTEFYNKLAEQGAKKEEDVLSQYKAKKLMEAEGKETALSDPKSKESKFAQSIAKRLGLKELENSSAAEINKYMPYISKAYSADTLAAGRAEMQAEKEKVAKERAQEKQQASVKKETKQLSEDLKDQSESLVSFDQIEGMLKKELKQPDFSFDTFDKEKFKGDLPGVNIPGIGRTTFYSSKARDLQSTIQTVLNKAIQSFAGKAVTKNELERINKQFAQGEFNTEAEMLQALARAKQSMRSAMKSSEAAYSPEAIELFQKRGGITSSYGLSKEKPNVDFDSPPADHELE